MATPPASMFDSVLQRMYQRGGVETLPAHLGKAYGITVTKMSQLDVGVFRVDRSGGGAPLVARLFSAARPYAAAEADLAVLRYLAEVGFPSERPLGDCPLTSHEGQALLVTEFVKQAAKDNRPPYPILTLGVIIGRLHGLAVPAGADRPAGALHHFAEGTMADELRAVAGWLDSIEDRVPSGGGDDLDTIRAAVAAADGGDGLPEAFVHPDPVPKNVIFTADGPVLVDWTSAGRGPRLASMALVLRSGWAAVPFMKGYSRVVTLTDEERDRLPGLLFSRQLIDLVFRVCRDPGTAVTTAKKLTALHRETEAKARDLLGVIRLRPPAQIPPSGQQSPQ
jgi:Ser/Thr protein kinase RdoA (MazF antagonist)